MSPSAPALGRLRLALWALAAGLGGLEAFAGRHVVNPDGIAYLDIADAYGRGDWTSALNAYWSPLYSWLLAPAVALARASPVWEFPLAHVVNLGIFVGAVAAFEALLVAVARLLGADGAARTALWLWGYALFLRATLTMATLRLVTPDVLVMAVTCLLAALLCRVSTGDERGRTLVALGIVAGVGYLAKQILLPVGVLALVLAAAGRGDGRRRRAGVVWAVLAMLVVAAPFVVAISLARGRFTVGEAGRLNYIWSLRAEGDRAQPMEGLLAHREGTHPPRKVLDAPAVWDFGRPGPGTVPLSFDPAYWSEGVRLRLEPRAQLRVLAVNAGAVGQVLRRWLPALTIVVLVLLIAGRAALGPAARLWRLDVLGLAPVLVYPVVWVEGRYLAAAVVLVLFVPFAAAVRSAPLEPRVATAAALAALLTLVVPPAAATLADVARDPGLRGAPPAVAVEAAAVRALGLRPGDAVAVVGNFYDVGWARLARVRVVATLDADRASDYDPRLAPALASTGARLVVSDRGPLRAIAPDDWIPLGGRLHAHRLDGR